MQGFKKTLVALLAVAMVLSLVGPVFAAPADVAGTKYEDAAVRLIALGIFKGDDKGNFNPEAPISRAEAAAVIIRALGLEKSADLMNGVTKFADVNADAGLQWATGAINVSVSSGIVNGYPNGQFAGRDNVTYAQLAKMVLYALNYGVTVEGGVWPTAVLAKADDLDILKGMTVVADAPITRGDAAKMLDNSLDVKSLRQTGYGDLKQFEETGDTMLKKLGLDELEARVVAVPVSDSGLKDDELKLQVTKKNGDDLKKDGAYTDVYTELEGVDVQSFFGLEVTAWVNDDDEIVFVEKKTGDSDVYADTIKEMKSSDKVKLQVADTDLKVAKDATIYVNYNEADYDDLHPGLYGRFVKKNNEIAFAVLFDFGKGEVKGGVVTSVDDTKIKYFTTSDKEKTLDLKDADASYIYDATLTAMDVKDIKKDNVIYWYEEDDEYFIVVSAKTAEGKLEKIKENKLTIDGKTYTFEAGSKKFEDEEYPYSYATYSLNEDADVKEYKKNVKDIEDLDGEEVIGLLDLKNYVRHVRGATDKTSGAQYGVVVGAPNDDEVRLFNKDGEEVKYAIDKRADYGFFTSSDDFNFYRDYNAGLKYAVTSYEVTANGKVAESDSDDKVGLAYAATVEYVAGAPKVTLNSEADQYKGVLTKNDDEEFVMVGGKKFFVDEDTVVIRTLDDKELDPEVIKWDDFKELDIDGDTDKSYAVVFGESGKTADAIMFVQYDFQGWSADDYFAVVLDKPYYSGGDWKADLDLFDIGEKTYVLKSSPDKKFVEGAIISFRLNAKGEVDNVDFTTKSGKVDDKYIDDVKIHSNAVIYQLDDGDIDRELSIGDIDDKFVTYVGNKGVAKVVTYEKNMNDVDKVIALINALPSKITEADAAKVTAARKAYDKLTSSQKKLVTNYDELEAAEKALGGGIGEGTVTYKNTTTHKIEVDNVVYTLDANSILRNAEGTIIADSITAIEAKLIEDVSVVYDIVAKDGVISSFKLQTAAADTLSVANITGHVAGAAVPVEIKAIDSVSEAVDTSYAKTVSVTLGGAVTLTDDVTFVKGVGTLTIPAASAPTTPGTSAAITVDGDSLTQGSFTITTVAGKAAAMTLNHPGAVQYVKETLAITGLQDAEGNNIAGDYTVKVVSDKDGEVFNAKTTVTAGAANVDVTLTTVATHTLTVTVDGFSKTTTAVISADTTAPGWTSVDAATLNGGSISIVDTGAAANVINEAESGVASVVITIAGTQYTGTVNAAGTAVTFTGLPVVTAGDNYSISITDVVGNNTNVAGIVQ